MRRFPLVVLIALGTIWAFAPLIHANSSSLAWVGKNCTSRYSCGSESALCIDGTCSLCSAGLNRTICQDSINVMQRCLPQDTSLDYNVCLHQTNTTFPCVCRHKPLLYHGDLELFDIIGGLVVSLFRMIRAPIYDPNQNSADSRIPNSVTPEKLFVASCAAAGGGIGGGGLYVPILVLLYQYSAQAAVPLSNVLILGASIANFAQMAPKILPGNRYGRPLIDYGMALALQPSQLAGTVIGVLLNVIFPDWLVLVLLVVTLSVSVWRSTLKGIALCKKERQLKKEFEMMVDSPDQPRKPLQENLPDVPPHLIESRFPAVKILALFIILGIVTAHTIVVGTPTKPSYAGIAFCSATYFGLLVVIFPVLAISIVLTSWYLIREAQQKERDGYIFTKDEFRWTKPRVLVLSLISVLAGLMSSLLGIGGGTVMSPLLLELNILPESVAATSTFMILFTSGSSVIQFALSGKIPWDYGVLFLIIGVFTSAFGQTVLSFAIDKLGRRSILVWLIIFIIFASMVLLVVIGGLDLATRLQQGGSVGFKTFCHV